MGLTCESKMDATRSGNDMAERALNLAVTENKGGKHGQDDQDDGQLWHLPAAEKPPRDRCRFKSTESSNCAFPGLRNGSKMPCEL